MRADAKALYDAYARDRAPNPPYSLREFHQLTSAEQDAWKVEAYTNLDAEHDALVKRVKELRKIRSDVIAGMEIKTIRTARRIIAKLLDAIDQCEPE